MGGHILRCNDDINRIFQQLHKFNSPRKSKVITNGMYEMFEGKWSASCALRHPVLARGPRRVVILGSAVVYGSVLGHRTWRYRFKLLR